MALISVAGVTAHQLITAGPRRSRTEREQARIDRTIARRERAARRAAVRDATIQLDGIGHARLIFEPGAAALSRGRLSRSRLEPDDAIAALDAASVRASDPIQARAAVRVPEPVPGQEPVRPRCTGTAAEPATTQTTPGEDREQARVAGALGSLNSDASRHDGPVDRNAVVAELADQIRDAADAGDVWRPDYAALMAATGRKRSWCEKVVRDARIAVLGVPACTDDDRTDGDTDEIRADTPGTVFARTGDGDRTGHPV
jgi:hypothetical protein